MAGRGGRGGRGGKRKSSETGEKEEEKKKRSEREAAEVKEELKIEINRAPVLTLWVAVVAEREGYSFQEGLSFGKVIAGILAHSKGRRLGIYEDKDRDEAQQKPKRRRKEEEKFRVFGMRISGQTTKPEGTRLALQGNKPVSPSSVESYLLRAFGTRYQQAKEAMQGLANAYTPERIGGSEAYSLYEKIRPQVSAGRRGWGAKGYLDLNLIRKLQKQAQSAL